MTDSSGSVVPGATVTARNAGTGAVQVTTSDSQGRYTIPALPVGDYEVQTEIQGFQTVIRTGIRLSAGADVVVDFNLPVGEMAEPLTVTAAAPLVNTTSASLGTVVDPTQIRELPLNGRNFEELVLLAPGVNVSRGSGSARNAFTGKQEYWTVSGSRPNGQEILMDGTNIQTYQNRGTGTGILGTSLGVDAIGEFQVLTNTYGAQYGGNGSVLNSVTRSGTNAFHGSLYEFYRNSRFDEVQWPATQKQPFWKHQNGGTIGGPLRTNRMFFFGNIEYIRQNESQSQIRVVPNALARQGIIPLPAEWCSRRRLCRRDHPRPPELRHGHPEPGQLPAGEAVPGPVSARSQLSPGTCPRSENCRDTRAPASAIRRTRAMARRRSSSTRRRPGRNISRWGVLTGTSRNRTTCLRGTCSTTPTRRSRSTATFPRGRSWRIPATSTSPLERRRSSRARS